LACIAASARWLPDVETEAMAAELVDCFDPLPEEVGNLLQVVALKRV
jgi:transcription-repair coupling factor (superfamily II helicase)